MDTGSWEKDVQGLTDAELAVRSQRGDATAFAQLTRRWELPLFRFVRRMIGNDEDARDACQDALLKAYRNIHHLRDPGKFKAWLHHIAANRCRDHHRHRTARPVCSFEESRVGDDLREDRAAPDRDAERSNMAEILKEVLQRLPDEQRTAILLREYQGFTSEEIGQMTGVPAATVRTRIFYGLKAMRRMLKGFGIQDASFLSGER